MKAPPFRLKDLNGTTHSLDMYRGKVIWLDFWVSWCAACLADLPRKQVLHRGMRRPDLVYLTIHVTGRDPDPAKAARLVEESGFTFPVLRDEGRNTYDAFGLSSVPSTVLIRRDGTVHDIYNETIPLPAIMAEAARLLEEKP
ncbi:TlpA family protein disulfide reductase [Staphylospora marina]|uniref:TlpA family protein disulfide reductase n=1 Tax=Staphylospora marina TaxID=2490858 RepID=UPI001F14D530|nr:TlpA disulfide reductase family protein [Staphylospora marina]